MMVDLARKYPTPQNLIEWDVFLRDTIFPSIAKELPANYKIICDGEYIGIKKEEEYTIFRNSQSLSRNTVMLFR